MVPKRAQLFRCGGGVRQGASVTKEELLIISHQQALEADNNPEDCLFIQLTRREIWLLLYGLLWSTTTAPELEDNAVSLQEKFAEVLDVQRPDWRSKDYGDEAAA